MAAAVRRLRGHDRTGLGRGASYAGDEPHYLLAAESLRHDADVDVADEYAARAYDEFHDGALAPRGHRTKGRLDEPYGVGFPLLILPAYSLGGAEAVELFLAALAAIALTLAYRLALRAAPDPWALGATVAAGLSAPFLAWGTVVYPELAAGAFLAGAALLALKLDERTGWRVAFGCFALLGALPWLGVRFVPAGVVIGVLAARALWRSRRRTLAIGAVEVSLFSVALCVGHQRGPLRRPYPVLGRRLRHRRRRASPTTSAACRAPRTLFVDPGFGLLRWAPLFALAFVGLWWLWRSRRDHLARAVSQLHTGWS